MLKIEFTGQFKKDYKLAIKRGCNPNKLEEVITLLCSEEPLPEKYRDHALTNSRNYVGMRESIDLLTQNGKKTISTKCLMIY